MQNFSQAYFDLLQFIKSANIISNNQMNVYFKKKNIHLAKQNAILKSMFSRKEIYKDASGAYFVSSENVTYKAFTPPLEKAIWFYIDNCDKYNYCNFSPKIPACLYMCTTNKSNFKDLTVFYLPLGTERIQARIMDTNYGSMSSKIDTILLVSSLENLSEIYLSDIFNIVNIAVIDPEGNVTYLK